MEITRLESNEADRWNDLVERTSVAMPFHRHEALEAMGRAYDCDFHLLCGFKGEQPVGILPVFEKQRGPLTFVYSPPTELEVPYMGPVLLSTGQLKQRKAEQWNQRFINGCLKLIRRNIDPDFVDIRAADRYDDPRPFIWNEFEVEPAFTHILDLSLGPDALFERFSSGARRNIRNAEESAYEIEEGDQQDIRRIIDALRSRIDSKDDFAPRDTEGIQLDPNFAIDLYERLPDGYVRPIVCRVDGEFVGGEITIERGDTVYTWHGTPKSNADLPVNELLDWHVMQDAIERDKKRLDLVGGMLPGVSGYKAKFNTKVRPIYKASKKSQRMRVVSSLYGQLPTPLKSALNS